ncbi:MAG: HD family hydrolase [bacterium]|nr:HD family hydrolase [bacterium]
MDQKPKNELDFLLTANRLKNTPRTGWAVRGVSDFESVADHSFGVALTALTISEMIEGSFDREKILTMAILHDLAESVTGDLSLGGSRLLPQGAKAEAEERAMEELLSNMGFAQRWTRVWLEFENLENDEARIVRDADRVDLLTQALVYERTTGTVNLEEFWQFAPVKSFHFAESRGLIEQLLERRPRQK